ncbi:MAG: hypothetical protein HW389_1081 [Bacteroidetes bacterium]|nr:hypothetical protein [Bacteroidota bacterium]
MKSHSLFPSRALSVLLLLIFVAALAHAQFTFQIGAGVGVAIPASDYAGTTVDFYNGTKYGLGSGLNLQAKTRFGLLGLRLTGEVDYSSFGKSGEAQPGQGTIDLSQKVVAIKVGPEFYMGVPFAPVTPYIGINVALSRFSGQVQFQGVAKVPSATYDLATAVRLGAGFNGGVLVKLGSFTSLDLGVSYDLMNASDKAWEDTNRAQDQRLDSYIALNDNRDPLYRAGDEKHFINNARDINAFQVKATIMVGL